MAVGLKLVGPPLPNTPIPYPQTRQQRKHATHANVPMLIQPSHVMLLDKTLVLVQHPLHPPHGQPGRGRPCY